MSFSVNTNAGALASLQNLSVTNSTLNALQTQINTGLKVSSAKDNAAVFSIAQNLRSDIAGYNAVNNSLDRGISEVDVAIAAGEAVSDLLIEMKEKTVSAIDSSLDAESRASLRQDIIQLRDQVTSVIQSAEFNGRNLLQGDALNAITDDTGSDSKALTKSFNPLSTEALNIDEINVEPGGGGANTPVPDGTAFSTTISGAVSASSAGGAEYVSRVEDFINDSSNEDAIRDAYNTISLGGDYDTDIGNLNFDSATGVFTAGGGADSSHYAGAVSIAIADAFGLNGLFVDDGGGGSVIYHNESNSGAPIYLTSTGFSAEATSPDLVSNIEDAITTVNATLSDLGSIANRLSIQKTFTGKLQDGLGIGVGNLVDADLAKVSAELQSTQVKQQLGLQALSIANQAPQSVLSLFR